MKLLRPAALLSFCALVTTGPASAVRCLPQGPNLEQTATTTSPTATVTLPAGSKVRLALSSPVWASRARAREPVYAVTAFPAVAENNTMAIPAGTYVLGQIDAVTKPSWKDARALFQMHFVKIIFANGYTVELESAPLQAATATVHVRVSSGNDVLLDNGSQFEMTVEAPLSLEANRVAEAIRRTRPLPLGAARSATMCVPIPAIPGTPDTVIPGTPGTPGTPDIVIPGPNGTTTVIPGTPASPGTPPTIIPGILASPAIPCPAPPFVLSGPSGPQIHRHSFQVTGELVVSGKKLGPGHYEVAWLGREAAVQVDLQQNGKTVARLAARVSLLPENSLADKTVTRTNADGSPTIASLEFAGERFALVFD